MRQYIATFLALTTLSIYGQVRQFKGQIIEGTYDETKKQPLTVIYYVGGCLEGNAKRSGMDFYENDSIETSTDKDYYKNPYDKGHIAPAANYKCDLCMLVKTFSYLNCALQHKDLNRGAWKTLEFREREMYDVYGTLKVEVDVLFEKNLGKTKGGATIPSHFVKRIYKTSPKLMLINEYRFENFGEFKVTAK